MSRLSCAAALLATVLVLTACGSGSKDNGTGGIAPAPPTPQRGDLLGFPLLKTYVPQELLVLAAQSEIGKSLIQLSVAPRCSVSVYQLKYQTVGATGEAATASGALMVPSGADAACQGARPILLYAHGVSADRTYNIANLTSSNPASAEGVAIAAVFAARGYIVIAPNYAGYDTSSLTYHPYLNADQQSKEMIDILKAGRSALPTPLAPAAIDDGKLFITGYSEGGYVAMATHRAMQAAGSTVTAAAPMSGPYALSAFGDAIFRGQVPMSAPANLTLLISGYDIAYGDIFANPTDAFEAKYATGIAALLPSTTSLPDLRAQGKIPATVVFNSTPPDAAFAPLTPATEPAAFASVFAQGFGPDFLITNAYRLSYLQDTQTAPDGALPTKTDGLPPANPTNTLRRALKLNDLRSWTPTAPVLLCGGSEDPTVLYLNTQLIEGYWAAAAPTASVTIVNLDSIPTLGDPYAAVKAGFLAAKELVRTGAVGGSASGGDQAVFSAYHSTLVPPFCLNAAKSFFDAH
jgi:hypothetical protein